MKLLLTFYHWVCDAFTIVDFVQKPFISSFFVIALLVTIVTFLVATLTMAITVKVNVTVMKITVNQPLDVKVHSEY